MTVRCWLSLTHAFSQCVGVGKFHAVKTINIPCFSSFHLPGRVLLILYFQHCLSIVLWVHLLTDTTGRQTLSLFCCHPSLAGGERSKCKISKCPNPPAQSHGLGSVGWQIHFCGITPHRDWEVLVPPPLLFQNRGEARQTHVPTAYA